MNFSSEYLPYAISGTVIELSAMFVDKIIFLNLGCGGTNAFRCSSLVIDECNGNIYHCILLELLALELKKKKFKRFIKY